MEAHRFGQYLVNCQVVTHEDILHALRIQDSRMPRIGELAVARHYLTKTQVQNILHQQKGTNEYFCEVANRLGYITTEQAFELVNAQLKSRPKIGQILVEQHLVDQDTLKRHLCEFHKKYPAKQAAANYNEKLISAIG